MVRQRYTKLIGIACLLLLNTFFIVSCKQDQLNPDETPVIVDDPQGGYPFIQKEVNYKPTLVPDNPADLVFYYDLHGPVRLSDLKDTVVVFLQGGPKHFLDTSTVSTVTQYYSVYSQGHYSTVGLQQAHYFNPTVFGSGSQFTAQNATETNNASFEMLERTIKWLKSGNKTVIVHGHSNGSLVSQAYLTTGRTLPDFTCISATRLIAVPEIFATYNAKKDFKYTDGGTKLVTNEVPADKQPYFNVLAKLQLDDLRNYINLLAGKPFLPRVIYMFGANDEALGSLTEAEKKFLVDNKVPNVTITIYGGTHGAAILGIPSAIPYIRQFK